MPVALNLQPPPFATIQSGAYVVARVSKDQFRLAYVHKVGVGQFDVMWWDDTFGVIPHHEVLFCGCRQSAQNLIAWLDTVIAEDRAYDARQQTEAEAAKSGPLGAFRAWLSTRRKRRVAWASRSPMSAGSSHQG